jgi:hypothetical protein
MRLAFRFEMREEWRSGQPARVGEDLMRDGSMREQFGAIERDPLSSIFFTMFFDPAHLARAIRLRYSFERSPAQPAQTK